MGARTLFSYQCEVLPHIRGQHRARPRAKRTAPAHITVQGVNRARAAGTGMDDLLQMGLSDLPFGRQRQFEVLLFPSRSK
jgi:hypothetical protein